MSNVITTRQDFKQYCLRRLGFPVIELNLDDDQVEDRIDDALQYFWDYHFDGSEKIFFRHVWQPNDFPDKFKEIVIVNGGTGYSNTDTITIVNGTGDEIGRAHV